jgi:hypothetical protein
MTRTKFDLLICIVTDRLSVKERRLLAYASSPAATGAAAVTG